ncbi:MAG: transcriptional repressor [Hyphomicrobiales bacterium]|nr:transcriptional repressor [Hyphomicrobiales bacterium]
MTHFFDSTERPPEVNDFHLLDNSPKIAQKLRNAGLRPTRQRTALAEILFRNEDRHVSAEMLFEEAKQANISISLATVYNTLNQFSDAGLLRTISIDSSRIYFDTKIGDHHHFFLEDSEELVDMPEGYIRVENLPPIPAGTDISRVDVIVRVCSPKK